MAGPTDEARWRGIAPAADPEPVDGAGEESLVARLRVGEDDAYRELLRIHGGRLLGLARRLMRNEEDARECLQEAFLSAFRAIDGFEGHSKLGTWLHRIVVNACLMRMRSQTRKPEELVDPQQPRFDEYGFRVGPTELPPDGVDRLFERAEVRDGVRRAIDRLPETHRTVLILRDIEQLSTAEVAESIGITPGAVKVRLHRARLALREQIGSTWE